MSKYQFYVARLNEEPTVVKNFKWVTKLYNFILRNPAMFAGRTLTIYKNSKPFVDLSYLEIKKRVEINNKEGQERRELLELSNYKM